TSTTGNILEVVGNSLLRGAVTAYNTVTASRFVATSTVASVLPYASSTAFSANTAAFGATATSTFGTNGALTLSQALGIGSGGTGTSTSPTYGKILVGNSGGTFDYLATSSLGINSGVWGQITGTLSNQTDLQNALNAKLDATTDKGFFFSTTSALN